MNYNKTQKYIKLLQVVVVVISVYLILKYLLPLVLPFVIAFFLYRIFYPWSEKLGRKTHISPTIWTCIFVLGFVINKFFSYHIIKFRLSTILLWFPTYIRTVGFLKRILFIWRRKKTP